MKLYATTTSERATKGQGGNSFLNIDIFIEDRNTPIYSIHIDTNILEVKYFNEKDYLLRLLNDVKPKGKSQKGEKCQAEIGTNIFCNNNSDGNSKYCNGHQYCNGILKN